MGCDASMGCDDSMGCTRAGFRPPFRATLARFRPHLGDVPRTLPDSGQIRPGAGQLLASAVELGPTVADIGKALAELDRSRPPIVRPTLAGVRSDYEHIRPNVGPRWLISTESRWRRPPLMPSGGKGIRLAFKVMPKPGFWGGGPIAATAQQPRERAPPPIWRR